MKSIMEKIRKLLALSESSNPHEASNAAEKARKLLLQHNLTVHDLKQEKETEVKAKLWQHGLKESTWRVYLVSTVFEQFFCNLVTTPSGCWYIVGKPGNGEAAEVMLAYLLDALEQAVKQRQQERDAEQEKTKELYREWGMDLPANAFGPPSYLWAEDFRLGWSLAVCKRLMELREKDTPEEHALVVQESKEVDDFLTGIGAQVGEAPPPEKGVSKQAFYEGQMLGEAVPLSTMVEGSAGADAG